MEELHRIGFKRKQILVKFLKEKKLLGDFIGNYMNKARKYRINVNDIFNNYPLSDLIYSFFHISSISYPKNTKGITDMMFFWENIQKEWQTFVYYQKYKEKYSIW